MVKTIATKLAKPAIGILITGLAIFAPTTHIAAIDQNTATWRIPTNCENIKIQLKALQKVDSRMRVYLGSKYELILTNFMTNLNLRLVRNNLATMELTSLQTTFSSERERFKADFTRYSQELEKLIETDCRAEPEKFYDQLEFVRKWRADVQASCNRLTGVIEQHHTAVTKLKNEP